MSAARVKCPTCGRLIEVVGECGAVSAFLLGALQADRSGEPWLTRSSGLFLGELLPPSEILLPRLLMTNDPELG